MRIIPVVDLMVGQVVRGVAGRRDEYRPIRSRLCDSSQPGDVAHALAQRFDFDELYVADLDAIAGREPAWSIYRDLAAHVPRLIVDAGVRDAAQAARLAEFRFDVPAGCQEVAGVVAGLESVPSRGTLGEMLELVGPERLVFSLDLKSGQPLTDSSGWRGLDAWDIAQSALAIGVRRMIVLDLARVGMHGGVGTEELCRRLRAADAEIEIIAGGGVRGVHDLESLAVAGCDGALVASVLHDGRLRKDDVQGWHTLRNEGRGQLPL